MNATARPQAIEYAQPDDVRRFLELLHRPGEVRELRALSKRRKVQHAGFFDDMNALARAAVERSQRRQDEGIYVTLNPVHDGLLSRYPANRVHEASLGTSSDNNVLARRFLLIDLDPDRPSNISSTDKEHAAAIAIVTEIERQLAGLGWPSPLIGDSGNGGHLLYAIDLPVKDGELVKRALARLAELYPPETGCKVDTEVYNPARVTKIYGTIARKGENTANRPHRISRIISAPAELAIVTRGQLEAFAPAKSADRKSARRQAGQRTSRSEPQWSAERAAAFFPDAVEKPWNVSGARRKWILPECPKDPSHIRTAFIGAMNSGAWVARCLNTACTWDGSDLRDQLDPGWRERSKEHRISHREEPPQIDNDEIAEDIDAAEARAIRDEQIGDESAATDGADAPHVNGSSGARHAPPPDPPPRETRDRTDEPDAPPAEPPTDARDVPPPRDESDAAGDENPNAPWRGGKGPAAMAFDFVRKHANHADGPTLRKWRGEFYGWTPERGCYKVRTTDQIESMLHRGLRLSHPKDVDYARNALIAVDDVLIDDVELGSWIGRPPVDWDSRDICATRNGLLHLPTRKLYAATPKYFATSVLGTVYDSNARGPKEWHGFLRKLWPKDDESIALLQEWFGYLLTLDTRQQKILGLIGPTRSGKGTIARVLTALLGRESVCGPTLASLGTNFGLAPLIGKSAAIISDARLAGRVDMAQIVERLLNLSGEDIVSIDRKFLSSWIGYLMARFMLISNELPAFNESSGALADRFVMLELTESFLGKEDHGLTDRLLGELPGILRWAIEGWERLRKRGKFLQPSSSADLIDDIAELASPVKAWLRQRCDSAPGQQYRARDAHADYLGWASEQGHKMPLTSNMFGRNLRALGIRPGHIAQGAYRGDKSYAGIMRKPELKDYPPPGARRTNREADGSEPA